MRILISVWHPAHFHFFKNIIIKLKEKGHEVLVISRNKEQTLELVSKAGINYKVVGKHEKGNFFMTCNQIWKQTHDPITLDMITTGENIIVNDITGSFYKLTHDRKQYFTKNMKEYHNLVKRKILEMAVYDRKGLSFSSLLRLTSLTFFLSGLSPIFPNKGCA